MELIMKHLTYEVQLIKRVDSTYFLKQTLERLLGLYTNKINYKKEMKSISGILTNGSYTTTARNFIHTALKEN